MGCMVYDGTLGHGGTKKCGLGGAQVIFVGRGLHAVNTKYTSKLQWITGGTDERGVAGWTNG